MHRVFVTGATGFIGAAVTRQLVASGYAVAALIRPQSSTWRLGEAVDHIRVIHGALDAPHAFEPGLCDFRPDTVMHLAWQGVGKAHRNDPAQIRINICGAVDLLTMAVKAGCRTFIGAGSQAEYGPSAAVLSENSPTCPNTVYGATKLTTYVLLSQLATMHDVRLAWLRVFSVFGPQDDADTLITYVITELLSRRAPSVSAGHQLWDYLYIDDAAAAFIAVGESQQGGVVNVASGEAQPLRHTIARLRDAVDLALPIFFAEDPVPQSRLTPLLASVTRLRQLGWRPTISLDEAIAHTVAWHRTRLVR